MPAADIARLFERSAAEARAFQDQIWLISFCDLVGCLLAAFVMLFAMTGMDIPAFLGPDDEVAAGGATASDHPADMDAFADSGRDLGYLAELLRQQVDGEPRLAGVTVRYSAGKLALSLPPDRSDAEPIRALAGILRNLPNEIEVEGVALTDLAAGGDSDKAWQAALTLALATIRSLEAAGYSAPVTARGRLLDMSGTPGGTPSAGGRWANIIVHRSGSQPL